MPQIQFKEFEQCKHTQNFNTANQSKTVSGENIFWSTRVPNLQFLVYIQRHPTPSSIKTDFFTSIFEDFAHL